MLKNLNDPTPFIRGIVAELGFKRKDIEFEQPKRKAGKTHNNFYSLYDAAMLSFTSYTKMGLRIATFAGFGIGYLIMKLFGGTDSPAVLLLQLFAQCLSAVFSFSSSVSSVNTL